MLASNSGTEVGVVSNGELDRDDNSPVMVKTVQVGTESGLTTSSSSLVGGEVGWSGLPASSSSLAGGEVALVLSSGTTEKDIRTNMNAGFQQVMQVNHQGMAALLARIQGTDASVAFIGHAVDMHRLAFRERPLSFGMPAPTAAAVTGYGGGGGMIAAAAGADAALSGAPNEVSAAVTETALACADTPPVDPRLVGAPYPPATTEASPLIRGCYILVRLENRQQRELAACQTNHRNKPTPLRAAAPARSARALRGAPALWTDTRHPAPAA